MHPLWQPLLLALGAVLVTAAGVVAHALIFRRPDRPTLPLAIPCLGLASWIAVAFLLASIGWLNAPVLATIAVTVLAAGFVLAWRRHGLDRSRPGAVGLGHRSLVVAAVASALLPVLLLALTPTVSWDAAAYHLTIPRLYLEAGGFVPVPFNVYSSWPLNTELLFALAMMLGGYGLAKLAHFACGLLTLRAIAVACRSRRPTGAGAPGLLAIGLFLANPVVVFELRVAYVELAYAFFFLSGYLFIERALDEGDGDALLLAGICAGLLAGTKVTGPAGAAVLGAAYLPRLVVGWRRGDLAVASVRFGGRFLLPAVALWLPWPIKSAWLTGNPFYPFLYERFGGPHWSAELSERLAAWQRSIGMGREALDYLLLPARVILQGGHGYERFDGELGAFWIAVLPLTAILGWRLRRARRALGVAGLYFVLWAVSAQQARFLVPILPLLAIAAAQTATHWIGRLSQLRWRRLAWSLALTATAAAYLTIHARTLAAGLRTATIYASAEPASLRASAVPEVCRFVNRELPPRAKLLFLNTNQGFFCHRPYIADSFFEASQVAEWLRPARSIEELQELLADEGITHVLLERRQLGIDYPPALGALLEDPAHAAIVFRSRDGRRLLFELLSDQGGPQPASNVLRKSNR